MREGLPGIGQVLEHVGKQHGAERLGAEPFPHRGIVEAALEDLHPLARGRRRSRIGLNAEDRVPAPQQHSRQVPAGAADVEHPRAGAHLISSTSRWLCASPLRATSSS